jgi:hypothetical protein
VIDEPQSAVVRRIFEQSARGEGLRSIARQLNAEGVHPPRPRSMAARGRASWSPSALQALLQNPLYRGELIWNRSEWIKDHATGKRRRFERPENEWIRREAPNLAVVSRDLWEWVQAVKYQRRSVYVTKPGGGLVTTRAGAGHRSRGRHLFSGLLECAQCRGSFFDLHGTGFLGCGWHRDRGRESLHAQLGAVPPTSIGGCSGTEGPPVGFVSRRVTIPHELVAA